MVLGERTVAVKVRGNMGGRCLSTIIKVALGSIKTYKGFVCRYVGTVGDNLVQQKRIWGQSRIMFQRVEVCCSRMLARM